MAPRGVEDRARLVRLDHRAAAVAQRRHDLAPRAVLGVGDEDARRAARAARAESRWRRRAGVLKHPCPFWPWTCPAPHESRASRGRTPAARKTCANPRAATRNRRAPAPQSPSSARRRTTYDRAARRVELGEALRELHEVLEVVHRRVAARVALAHERRPVDRREDHAVAADVEAGCGPARRTRAAP